MENPVSKEYIQSLKDRQVALEKNKVNVTNQITNLVQATLRIDGAIGLLKELISKAGEDSSNKSVEESSPTEDK